MKKFSIIAILAILLIGCSSEMSRVFVNQGYSFAGKKKIALINIYVKTRRTLTSTRRFMIAEYELQLRKRGYKIIEQSIIAKVLTSLNIQTDREISITEIKKLKDKLNVEIIVQGFVSEEAESLISSDMNINLHFKYYDGSNGDFVAEALYQYRGSDTIIKASFVKKAIIKVLKPFGIGEN